MASTTLSDLIVPSVFDPYVQLRSVELSALYQSGIIQTDAKLDALAKGDGKTFNMPFFNDLSNTSSSNVSSDDTAQSATAQKITAGQDVAVKHYRNQSWSSADLNAAVVGTDPMRAVADLVAGYWVRDMQRILIASLTGILLDNAANDASDMLVDVATDAVGAPTADELISAENIITAQQTMGDHSGAIVAIAMHSVPYARLRKLNLIQFIPNSVNAAAAAIPTYLGMRVIVDDQCPAVAGTNRIKYTSYLFGAGAVGFGQGQPKTPSEVQRWANQGNGEGVEILYSRNHFILHPRGIKATNASVAGASPTNTELALAANWDRVYDRKLVRIAALRTNG